MLKHCLNFTGILSKENSALDFQPTILFQINFIKLSLLTKTLRKFTASLST